MTLGLEGFLKRNRECVISIEQTCECLRELAETETISEVHGKVVDMKVILISRVLYVVDSVASCGQLCGREGSSRDQVFQDGCEDLHSNDEEDNA